MFNGTWPSSQRRSTAFSQQGMAASASPNAALVGARTLGDGGTAFDAALSMALVEGVALPWACGLGGDTFCLLYHAATGQFRAVSGSGAAPSRATAELFRGQGLRVIPGDGPLSASVPGRARRVPAAPRELRLAFLGRPDPAGDRPGRPGLVVTPRLAYYLQAGQSRLESFPASVAEFFPDGQVPAIGTLLRRPALARTLREVAETERASFYGGPLGEAIARASEAAGGLLRTDDLAAHRAEIEAPVQTSYRGDEVYQPPLPSQGVIMLEMLNILEQFDLASLDPLGDKLIHLVAEAKRLAFEAPAAVVRRSTVRGGPAGTAALEGAGPRTRRAHPGGCQRSTRASRPHGSSQMTLPAVAPSMRRATRSC